MKKTFIILFLMVGIVSVASAQMERSYFEPQVIAGFGKGEIESYLNPDIVNKYRSRNLGIGFKLFQPLDERHSLVFNGYYLNSKVDPDFASGDETVNSFNLRISIRFYR